MDPRILADQLGAIPCHHPLRGQTLLSRCVSPEERLHDSVQAHQAVVVAVRAQAPRFFFVLLCLFRFLFDAIFFVVSFPIESCGER